MPVFFIEPEAIHGDGITLTGPLAHHLVESLRIQPGEELWLGHSGGLRFRARAIRADPGRLTADIISRADPPPASSPHTTLGLALIKSEHMDWAIQKATELGITRLVPLVTARTVIRLSPERIPNRTARWRAIAREAAQQSMRWELPEVMEPKPFGTWCEQERETMCRLLLSEHPQGRGLRESLRGRQKPETIAMAIGPEGGFDDEEVRRAEECGFENVSLGPRILRTESAVIAALAIIQYEWGDVG
jgi:16S rRNA (uracil1498-N3)-methyltransferase